MQVQLPRGTQQRHKGRERAGELSNWRTNLCMVDEIATAAGIITVKRAIESELEDIVAVLDSAAHWLASKGITDPWHPGEWPRKRIMESIERGEVYLSKLGQRNVATITLQWSDEFFWPNYPADAGYIHRLAVATGFHRKKIGSQLLQWAELSARDNGKKFLRLNCMAANLALRNYYERAGFIYRGELREPRGLACLYEKRLSP